jgi:hypothetical protein
MNLNDLAYRVQLNNDQAILGKLLLCWPKVRKNHHMGNWKLLDA